MIQGGCPQGTGTGGPGYTFEDEINEHKIVRGSLAMANAGPEHERLAVLPRHRRRRPVARRQAHRVRRSSTGWTPSTRSRASRPTPATARRTRRASSGSRWRRGSGSAGGRGAAGERQPRLGGEAQPRPSRGPGRSLTAGLSRRRRPPPPERRSGPRSPRGPSHPSGGRRAGSRRGRGSSRSPSAADSPGPRRGRR